MRYRELIKSVVLTAGLLLGLQIVDAQTLTPYDGTAPNALPYFCGFEDDTENQNWSLNAKDPIFGSFINLASEWGIDMAAHHTGRRSLYVHLPNVPDVAEYDGNNAVRTVAMREFTLAGGNYELSFDWRCLGDSLSDAIYVYWVPATTTMKNDLLSTNSFSLPSATSLKFNSKAYLSGSPVWKQERIAINIPGSSVQNYLLAFVWVNNTTKTYNPGACLDNVWINIAESSTDCWRSVENLTWETSTMTLSWNTVPNATSYSIIYWMEGYAYADTIVVTASGSGSTQAHQFANSDLMSGRYSFAVQTECPDGAGIWTELLNVKNLGLYSTVADACPDVKLNKKTDIFTDEEYLVPACKEGGITVVAPTLQASGGSIAGYHCDPIPYNPPFDFDTISLTPEQKQAIYTINADDNWADKLLTLPFGICFFDGTYRQALVGGNGIVTFDDRIAPGSSCSWSLKGQPDLADNGQSAEFVYKNSIMGVYQDYYPMTDLFPACAGYQIWCGVLGEWPCRMMVVTWYNVSMYGTRGDAGGGPRSSSMIVMYEGTNVIDVYIKDRWPDTGWQDGRGIVGIINSDGEEAVAAPKRNTSNAGWEAHNEAWRFSPYTTPIYDLTWYGYSTPDNSDPVVIGQKVCIGDKPDSLEITREMPYSSVSVTLSYQSCNGDYIEVSDTAHIRWNKIDTVQVTEYKCFGKPFSNQHLENITEAGFYYGYDLDEEDCPVTVYEYTIEEKELTVLEDEEVAICKGDYYEIGGIKYYDPGYIPITPVQYSDCDCDSVVGTVHISHLPMANFAMLPLAEICGDDANIPLNVNTDATNFRYSVYFDEHGHKAGFVDIIDKPILDLSELVVPLPQNVLPDYYWMKVELNADPCGSLEDTLEFVVNYPSAIAQQKWDDVLAVLNYNYNGHYNFSHFQWYKNGQPIEGANGSYYTLQEGDKLDPNDEYRVGLIRAGEEEEFFTCPIIPIDKGSGTQGTAQGTGVVTVTKTPAAQTMYVYDVLGRLLLAAPYDTKQLNDWLRQQQKGVYMVRVGSRVQKITNNYIN